MLPSSQITARCRASLNKAEDDEISAFLDEQELELESLMDEAELDDPDQGSWVRGSLWGMGLEAAFFLCVYALWHLRQVIP